MCFLCETGTFCPRHDTIRERLDANPLYEDARELELETRNAQLSAVEFEQPFKAAA